jgi:hypothetical protein
LFAVKLTHSETLHGASVDWAEACVFQEEKLKRGNIRMGERKRY